MAAAADGAKEHPIYAYVRGLARDIPGATPKRVLELLESSPLMSSVRDDERDKKISVVDKAILDAFRKLSIYTKIYEDPISDIPPGFDGLLHLRGRNLQDSERAPAGGGAGVAATSEMNNFNKAVNENNSHKHILKTHMDVFLKQKTNLEEELRQIGLIMDSMGTHVSPDIQKTHERLIQSLAKINKLYINTKLQYVAKKGGRRTRRRRTRRRCR